MSDLFDHGKEPDDSARRFVPPKPDLDKLKAAAAGCTACPLHARATQTVFGEGRAGARVMLIGEQPGDQEDLQGRPFVGPAGQLLDWALEKAGIDRTQAYVSNVVKHFKWVPRGKRRIHSKPSSMEIKACLPWLEAELEVVQPEIIVLLGATAAQALLGPTFRVTRERGRFLRSNLAPYVMATVHPSSLLRIEDDAERKDAIRQFVRELRQVAAVLDEKRGRLGNRTHRPEPTRPLTSSPRTTLQSVGGLFANSEGQADDDLRRDQATTLLRRVRLGLKSNCVIVPHRLGVPLPVVGPSAADTDSHGLMDQPNMRLTWERLMHGYRWLQASEWNRSLSSSLIILPPSGRRARIQLGRGGRLSARRLSSGHHTAMVCGAASAASAEPTMDFAPFDRRRYPTLPVREGYRKWSETYGAWCRTRWTCACWRGSGRSTGRRPAVRSTWRAAPAASAPGCGRRACSASTGSTSRRRCSPAPSRSGSTTA